MSRKLILASTMSMILVGTEAHALGVGALHTQSALNQPFLGQIELTDVKPDELDAVKVAIASSDAYAKAGLERYYYLTKLQFTPEVSSQGRTLVRVSSREPIREPYMDLLVEVVWPNGQLVKQYTLLLDPPSVASRRSPGGGGGVSDTRRGGGGAPGEGFPLAIGPVASGSGLWALARAHRPEGATVAQTAMALYRSNQHAFVRGNIHRLVAGKTLIVPSRDELFALDPAEASREYSAAVKGRAVRRSPVTDVAAYDDTAHLRIAASQPVSASMSAAASGARPPAPPPARSAGPGMEKDVLLALETSESTRQETQILRDRIKELETRLSDIQNLLQVRNDELARVQAGVATPGALAQVQPPVMPETAEVLPASPAPELPPATPADSSAVQPTAAQEAPPPVAETTSPPIAAEFPPPASTEAPAPGLLPPPEPPPAPVEPPVVAAAPAAPKPAPHPVEPESSSSWDSLLLPLAGVAGLTAVGILIFSWVTARRRRREETDKYVDTDSLAIDDLDEPPTEPHIDGKPGPSLEKSDSSSSGQGQDLGPQSTTNSRAAPDALASPVSMMSSLGNFDAETDEADVLSEADIYLAYGRHSEAEELLRNEMKRAPGRLDIKYKLAEAYAGTRNLSAMADLMREIEASGAPRTDPGHWRRLQELFERVKAPENQAAAATARSPAASEAPRHESSAAADNLLVDSMGLGIDDVLSLDLSEDQSLSTGAPVKGPGAGKPGLVRDMPSSGGDLLLDLGDETASEAVDDTSVGLPDIDTGRHSEAADLRSPPRDEPSPFRSPFEDLTDHSRGADSELILALEEQNVEMVDDLDSIFDTSSPDEDLTLVRDEMIAGRPSGVDQAAPGVPDSVPDSIRPSAEESMSTDLLSSQWQMDSGIWDETATKLDLARAYIEMDDSEAAREILHEVISEGREEQRQEARAMLEKMA